MTSGNFDKNLVHIIFQVCIVDLNKFERKLSQYKLYTAV